MGPKGAPNENTVKAQGKGPLCSIDVVNTLEYPQLIFSAFFLRLQVLQRSLGRTYAVTCSLSWA